MQISSRWTMCAGSSPLMMRVKMLATGRRVVDVATVGAVRVMTFPNLLTFMRLCCLPVFLWMLFGRESVAGAALMLGAIGMTDWVDGWVARRFAQESEFGAMFDPTVDRVLFVVAAVSVMLHPGVPDWYVSLILLRELLVGSMMVVGKLLGMKRFPVTTMGKRYTFLLMIAIPLLLLGTSDHPTGGAAWVAGWLLGVPGLVLSWYTAIDYIPRVRAAVRAGRAEGGVR